MELEARLAAVWGALVEGRVYPDTLPDTQTFPAMVYQQVGGRAGWYLEGAVPDRQHARIQLHVWAHARIEANALARQAEIALAESGLTAEPYGAFTALYDDVLKLYGTRQDFGIWHNDSE